MTLKNNPIVVLYAYAAVFAVCVGGPGDLDAAEGLATERQLQELQRQNRALEEQLRQQRILIDSLTRKVNQIEEANVTRYGESHRSGVEKNEGNEASKNSFGINKVNLSLEGGLAFFTTGSEGTFPNSEFRVDEARLFLEAPIWGDVYFFSELNLMTREASDLSLQLGEIYLDVENLSKLWNCERMLNLRLGRMYIPFGEEYLSRYAIDNPLISHSLSDIWGVDEGVEVYGKLGKFSYVMAVQNGGASGVRDFSGDKSIAGRIGLDPESWLHVSASAMRTGDLKPPGDYWSELYFANGWFLPFGSANTTKYHANLFEGDIDVRLPHGRIRAFGGYARYGDNDPNANNSRDIFYYSIEAVHDITRKLYAGIRFSQIFADKGYPIAGNGNQDDYIFSGELTEELWRLSLGLGYRWSQNLVTKAEYSFERGKEVGGGNRDHEDLFAVEAAFRF